MLYDNGWQCLLVDERCAESPCEGEVTMDTLWGEANKRATDPEEEMK